MHLMMRGADEDAPEHAAERNPHVRMLDVGVNEQHQDDVRIRQLIGGLAEHVVAETVGDRGRDREDVGEDPGADRMHAEIREGGQYFGVVVHFVEFSQQPHLVAEPVIEPVAELVGEMPWR